MQLKAINKKNIRELVNKKNLLRLITGLYITVMVFTTFYVPVKASLKISEDETFTEYGYYLIWEVLREHGAKTKIKISLNLIAWILQYMFLTLVFISMYIRTVRHYKKKEGALI